MEDNSVNSGGKVKELVRRNEENLSGESKEVLLQRLLSDPLLSDLPKQFLEPEFIDDLISQEMGLTITIFVEKETGERIPIVVSPHTTLRDVKNQLKCQFVKMLADTPWRNRNINWKYVWKNNCLMFEKTRLLDDKETILRMGVKSGSTLHFAEYRPPDKRGRSHH